MVIVVVSGLDKLRVQVLILSVMELVRKSAMTVDQSSWLLSLLNWSHRDALFEVESHFLVIVSLTRARILGYLSGLVSHVMMLFNVMVLRERVLHWLDHFALRATSLLRL